MRAGAFGTTLYKLAGKPGAAVAGEHCRLDRARGAADRGTLLGFRACARVVVTVAVVVCAYAAVGNALATRAPRPGWILMTCVVGLARASAHLPESLTGFVWRVLTAFAGT